MDHYQIIVYHVLNQKYYLKKLVLTLVLQIMLLLIKLILVKVYFFPQKLISILTYQNTNKQIKIIECDSSCMTCSGEGSNNCLSCENNLYFYEGQCLVECPVGFYPDSSLFICNSCPSTCLTCTSRKTFFFFFFLSFFQ